MSLKGTDTQVPAVGSQGPPFTPSPSPSAFITPRISGKHGAKAGCDAIEGFKPDGRKKLTAAAGITGPSGPDGTQLFTNSGLVVGGTAPAATAACQFLTKRSPRTVFALIGRFRCLPPL